MRAGLLNRRITIQARGTGQGSDGQPAGWTDVATVWADIRAKSGVQTMAADTPVGVGSYSMRIRYRTDLDASMRVVYQGLVYELTAPPLVDHAGRDYVDLVVEYRGQQWQQ